jgi:hypothetical protein
LVLIQVVAVQKAFWVNWQKKVPHLAGAAMLCSVRSVPCC